MPDAPAVISPRQQKILEYIRKYLKQNGYPPSIRDIVRGCATRSTSVADYHLKQLEARGYIRRHKEISRGIEVTYPARQEELQIPLLGAIAAGNPVPVPPVDSWDMARSAEKVGVPRYLVADCKGVFALKVKGDSMQDALIGDGDTILLQATEQVENGQTAAVWLEDRHEVTLKKVYHDRDRVRLQPANKRYAPILTSASNVRIQGRLVAVIRSFGQ